MDQQVPTSFIPKKPLDGGNAFHERGGLGFLFFIALFIFIAALAGAGGEFAYKSYLSAAIAEKQDSLRKAEGAFDISTIQDLIRMDSRIRNSNVLLQKHVAPSTLFAFLSQQTLQSVQFTSFEYHLQADGSGSMVLQGTAANFSALALQSDQFGASKQLKDVVFSDIKNAPGGTVNFSVSTTIEPSFINYAKNLGNMAAMPVVPVVPQVPPAATSSTSTTPR